MANLSKIKREQLLNEIEKLKTKLDANDFESLNTLNKLKQEITNKKYGLVWEEHSEKVDEMLVDNIPVFTEDKTREIVSDSSLPYNFLLEGDNLHSLKLLEKTHKEKIDIIYIDPPYNVGNGDFIYDDNFVDKDDKYRHSKWISFIYQRLIIAKKLLKESGIIFISIDDNELNSVILLCDDIFGVENKVAICPTIMNLKGNQSQTGFAGCHEYTVVYCRNIKNANFHEFEIDDEMIDTWEEDEIGFYKKGATLKRTGNDAPRDKRPKCYYPILVSKNDYSLEVITKNEYDQLYDSDSRTFNDDYIESLKSKYSNEFYFILPSIDNKPASWRWGFNTLCKDRSEIIVIKSENEISLYKKQRPELDIPTTKPKSVLYKKSYGSGTLDLKRIFNGNKVFTNPKPVSLIKDLITIGGNKDSLILDFFAGSGTTAQAILELNREDHGDRKFILCTNNENEICENVTYQRSLKVINGYSYKLKTNVINVAGIPANLKYYKTDFIPKNSNQNQSSQNQTTLDPTSGVNEITLCDKLQDHIKELIQLETHHNIDDDYYKMILNDADLSNLITNINKNPNLKEIYISSTILLDSNQKQILESKNIKVSEIPDYYFSNELKENGELW